MSSKRRYEFSELERQAYERIPVAMAVYQVLDRRVVTLLVSDGLCHLYGLDRKDLVDWLDSDMFGHVHPDDSVPLARMGFRFAQQAGPYDVTYRTRHREGGIYHRMHCTGEYRHMPDGTPLAFIHYMDLTANELARPEVEASFLEPVSRFARAHLGPLAIVAQSDHRVLFYTDALCRLLPLARPFDSPVSFEVLFGGESEASWAEVFLRVDEGPSVVKLPGTAQLRSVHVVSLFWDNIPALAVQFDENPRSRSTSAEVQRSDLELAQRAFNQVFLVGDRHGGRCTDLDFEGFAVWNLTRDRVFLSDDRWYHELGWDEPTWDQVRTSLLALATDAETRLFLGTYTRERLLESFVAGGCPKTQTVRLERHGEVLVYRFQLAMMRSPFNHAIYLKLQAKNVSARHRLDQLLAHGLSRLYDFVACADFERDQVFWLSQFANQNFHHPRSGSIETLLGSHQSRTLPVFLEAIGARTSDALEDQILQRCEALGSFDLVLDLGDSRFKRITVTPAPETRRVYYVVSSDMSDLVARQRQELEELSQLRQETESVNATLEQAVLSERARVERIMLDLVMAINRALDAKDPYTFKHSIRVAGYSAALARRLGWSEVQVQRLRRLALLHDIGKIGVPDAILCKPEALTPQEVATLRDHCRIGSQILKDLTLWKGIADAPLYHHEHFDGGGYPQGLRGDQIPLEIRIISIADALDAMNSDRSYRSQLPVARIIEEIEAQKGRQFDPQLAAIMVEMVHQGLLSPENDHLVENDQETLLSEFGWGTIL